MRDAQIVAMQEQGARRDGLILAQHEFLKTRQEALETVLLASSLKDRLVWLWNPARLLARAEVVQRALLARAREQMAAAAAKGRIQVVPGGALRV